ncbi:MAG: hypothetical protein IJQ33_09850 [Clostridia bacterium]|nr:hypothetical protein [Clostridia bacterium]
MQGSKGLSRYRAIDLTLFAVMLFVFEGIIITASTRWFPGEPYTVSVVPLIVAVVLMRWGPWAGVHAILGGLVFCAFSEADTWQYVIYCGGNLFSLGALTVLKALGDENIRQDALKTWLFGIAVMAFMFLGRAVLSFFFGAAVTTALGFFTTEVITVLFTLVILWIVRRLDGVFENQNHYLLRLRREQEKERGGY